MSNGMEPGCLTTVLPKPSCCPKESIVGGAEQQQQQQSKVSRKQPECCNTAVAMPESSGCQLTATAECHKLQSASRTALVDTNGNDMSTAAVPKSYHSRGSAGKDSAVHTAVEGSDGRRHGRASTSSFQALQHAVLTLYRLDDFSLEKIGEGFFSDVFKVSHRATGEVMALKMNRNGSNRVSMLREVELMNRLSHANILRFRGVCVHGGQLHAVIEYVNGGSLNQILTSGVSKLTWQERIELAVDIASGMGYLHAQGFFHRDLTSRNILVAIKEGKKTAIVSDFGLASKIPNPNDSESHLSVVGSPYWMAPECLRGDAYNQTADFFSYGIILCETIAMIDADPDSLPRTENFGLDYIAFCNLVDDCPLHFLYLAFRCAQMDPLRRPSFSEAEECLHSILQSLHQPSAPASPDSLIEASASRLLTDSGCTTMRSVTNVDSSRSSRRFSTRDFPGHKRSKSAGHLALSGLPSDESKDFLLLPNGNTSTATPQVVARHMTKEDPFYTPAPANTNPFANSQRFKGGRKLLASFEAEDDTSHRLPVDGALSLPFLLPSAAYPATLLRRQSLRHTSSLPELSDSRLQVPAVKGGLACAADDACDLRVEPNRGQGSSSGCAKATYCMDIVADSRSLGSSGYGEDLCCEAGPQRRSSTGQLRVQVHNKQLSLECAMLFCGLDLIRVQRSISGDASEPSSAADALANEGVQAAASLAAAAAGASPVDDLEWEFEDDLKDVLLSCSASNSLSSHRPVPVAFPSCVPALLKTSPSDEEDGGTGCATQCPPTCGDGQCGMLSSRYVNPTLTKKRRQLRQVRGRSSSASGSSASGSSDKLEQLQLKLDQLRQLQEADKRQRRRLSAVV